MIDKIELERIKTREKAKYTAFKDSYLNSVGADDVTVDKINEYIEGLSDESDDSDIALKAIQGMLAKEFLYIGNKNSNNEINAHYSYLLDKTKKLALELGLTNSLEISNLFSYLLWKGYFSKTKQNHYQQSGRKNIKGLYYADIMDGIGVCLNHADMLKDFLNKFDFSASILVNRVVPKMDVDYKMPLERLLVKSGVLLKTLTFLANPLTKKIGNHAFVLIRENDRLYIYDATNLCVFEVDDAFNASLINGKGISELHPYFSFINIKDVSKETIALDGLFELDDLSSPYSRKDFIVTSENNIEMFNSNICLLDDFYADTFRDISKISEITDVMVKSKRKK